MANRDFTPGPWSAVFFHDGSVVRFEIQDGRGGMPFTVATGGRRYFGGRDPAPPVYSEYTDDRLKANALLLAAAPDLLEALEQARAALPDAWAAVKCDAPVEVLQMIDAAIAKAKGGS